MANRYIRQDLEERMSALKINDGEAKCKFIDSAVREKLDTMDNDLMKLVSEARATNPRKAVGGE